MRERNVCDVGVGCGPLTKSVVYETEAEKVVSVSSFTSMDQSDDNVDQTFEILKTCRDQKEFEARRAEVQDIRSKFPTKVPVLVERFLREMYLPSLDRSKFLVPQEITMSQFMIIIRNRMQIRSTQAFYLLVDNRSMVSLSKTLGEVYNEHRDPDGYLHVTYASQEVFGADI